MVVAANLDVVIYFSKKRSCLKNFDFKIYFFKLKMVAAPNLDFKISLDKERSCFQNLDLKNIFVVVTI